MALNSIETIKQCVLKGIGVAMIPEMAVRKEIAQKEMTILPWPEEPLETALLMIRHKDKWLSPTLEAFMHVVREVIRTPKIDQQKFFSEYTGKKNLRIGN